MQCRRFQEITRCVKGVKKKAIGHTKATSECTAQGRQRERESTFVFEGDPSRPRKVKAWSKDPKGKGSFSFPFLLPSPFFFSRLNSSLHPDGTTLTRKKLQNNNKKNYEKTNTRNYSASPRKTSGPPRRSRPSATALTSTGPESGA